MILKNLKWHLLLKRGDDLYSERKENMALQNEEQDKFLQENLEKITEVNQRYEIDMINFRQQIDSLQRSEPSIRFWGGANSSRFQPAELCSWAQDREGEEHNAPRRTGGDPIVTPADQPKVWLRCHHFDKAGWDPPDQKWHWSPDLWLKFETFTFQYSVSPLFLKKKQNIFSFLPSHLSPRLRRQRRQKQQSGERRSLLSGEGGSSSEDGEGGGEGGGGLMEDDDASLARTDSMSQSQRGPRHRRMESVETRSSMDLPPDALLQVDAVHPPVYTNK